MEYIVKTTSGMSGILKTLQLRGAPGQFRIN